MPLKEQLRQVNPGPLTADLTVEGAILRLRGVIYLEVEISGKYYTGAFLVAKRLGEDLILRRNCLVQHRAVHDPFNNCLFIGRQQRERVFTAPGISQRNESDSEAFQETSQKTCDNLPQRWSSSSGTNLMSRDTS